MNIPSNKNAGDSARATVYAALAEPPKDRLVFFFAVSYLAHGISCAQFGIICQPIQSFMLNGLGLNAATISAYMALMMIPWVIKPFYGFLADFVPLFGYRRKSYIILANITACLAFLGMLASSNLHAILACLLLTAISMAVSTVLMVGLAVENGRDNGKIRRYLTVQEVAYYLANISAGVLGGLLCANFKPLECLQIAALIAALPPLLVSCVAAGSIAEPRSKLELDGLKQTARSLKEALGSPALKVVALFTFFWSFLPVFGVPLYCYETKTLGFAQERIGSLSACNSAGMLIGSMLYPLISKRFDTREQLYLTAGFCTFSTAAYVFLADNSFAVILEFCRGFASILAILSVYVLAAELCPRRIEVSVMAILVALRNLATNAATYTGGQLLGNGQPEAYMQLVFISSLSPMLTLAFISKAVELRAEKLSKTELQANSNS